MASSSHLPGAYWALSEAELLNRLGSGVQGLSEAEADRRLAQMVRPKRSEMSAVRLLARQFTSPLVLILCFATLVSLLVGEWIDAAIILSIVMGSGLLGFIQEYRASQAVAELRKRFGRTARVLRDGKPREIPSGNIVAGDVLILHAGDLVPADGRLTEANALLIDEAALTGESFPAEKAPGTFSADTALAQRTNCAFQGTAVRSGSGRLVVAGIGKDTIFGSLEETLERAEEQTEFARGLAAFGYMLARIMVVVVVLVFAASLVLHRPLVDSLLFALALAVAISPELLPAIVSTTLSTGAREMARHGVLVRRLEAIENFGSIDVLCTDKTGTLTAGVVALNGTLDSAGAPSTHVLQLAALNASFQSSFDNPIDSAIVRAAKAASVDLGGYEKRKEVPYDFSRRRLTVTVAKPGGGELTICKGALREVLAACTNVSTGEGPQPLDDQRRSQIETFAADKGHAGFRTIAVSTGDDGAATFEGFLLFFDPPKKGIRQAVTALADAQIAIKIVSGDNRFVTRHLALEVGLVDPEVLTGSDLAKLDDRALADRCEAIAVFAEIEPEQKERIVHALQATGHAVGYLGDGINDAPALKAADIGISVDQAVDVARESADIILLQRDLNVLRNGVEDGRRIFANTLKYISVTTSANFGNMISMALATLALPFLPLLPAQILLNNFLSDIPSIAIARDAVDPEHLETAQRWDIREVRRFMIVFGLISTLFDLLTFVMLRALFHADEAVFRTTWFLVSLLTELAVLLVLRTRRPFYRSAPAPLLLWSSVVVAAAALALPYAGHIAAIFHFVPLSGPLVLAALGTVFLYVAVTEIGKRGFYRTGRGTAGGATGKSRQAKQRAPTG